MKNLIALLISGALVVSGYSQTRNVLVGTNNAVVQPTNFWSADVTNARTGLGLGSAATNPASAFQPSSLNLSNVSTNNGGGLTNLNATSIVGAVSLAQGGTGATNASDARAALSLGTAATNPATAFQTSSSALSNLATGNGGALSNLQSTGIVGLIPASNIPSVTLTNIEGVLSVIQGGTGATNAATARQNIGITTVGDSLFTATDALFARTILGSLATNGNAISLTNFPTLLLRTNGSAAGLTNFPASLLTTNGNGAGLTNLTAANITGTVGLASNVIGTIAISNGGSGATTAGGARTNLGLGATNDVAFGGIILRDGDALKSEAAGDGDLIISAANIVFGGAIGFNSLTNAADTRTNLGLGWTALTNTNTAAFNTSLYGSGTNPVLYNTNGEVVSPTNFWQVAPIVTTFIESQPTTNQTTNIAAGRNLHIHSIAPSTVGITNTIALPTTNSFNGDIALVVHQGPTSSVTAVRTAGAGTNLITLNQFDQAVEFVYYNSVWQFNHNLSFIEPIFFSGTNASANAAASRTNLGLGATWLTNTNATNFRTAIGLGATNDVTFQAVNTYMLKFEDADVFEPETRVFFGAISFDNETSTATTRTNLGLGAASDVVFGSIDTERIEIQLGTNIYTYLGDDVNEFKVDSTFFNEVVMNTNLIVSGFVNFSTNHTNVAPATNNQIQKFLQIRIGTNAFFLPLYK